MARRPRVLSEDEYLNSKGVGSVLSGFMQDKTAGYRQIKTARGQERESRKLSSYQDRYYAKRNQARKEYSRLVKSGKVRPPTTRERMIRTAKGNPENASVRAARRFLKRHGISWRASTGSRGG